MTDQEIILDGYYHEIDGQASNHNPWNPSTRESALWMQGWKEGSDQFKKELEIRKRHAVKS